MDAKMKKPLKVMGWCFFGATVQLMGGLLLIRSNLLFGIVLFLGSIGLFFAPFYLLNKELKEINPPKPK